MKFLNKKVNDSVQHIILHKFTNFHAIRSWSSQNICNEIGWPRFFRHPVDRANWGDTKGDPLPELYISQRASYKSFVLKTQWTTKCSQYQMKLNLITTSKLRNNRVRCHCYVTSGGTKLTFFVVQTVLHSVENTILKTTVPAAIVNATFIIHRSSVAQSVMGYAIIWCGWKLDICWT